MLMSSYLVRHDHVVEDPIVVDLDFGDHVAGHEAADAVAFAPVEAVRILLSNDLMKEYVNEINRILSPMSKPVKSSQESDVSSKI